MKKTSKYRIGELLFQIIPVTIGVFLGFLLSNLAEKSKIENDISTFQQSLIEEIKSNKQKIEKNIDYHIMLRDSARYYSTLGTLEKRPEFFRGLRTWALTSSAFETGLQTGIVNELEFNNIQLVNNSYTLQHSYNDFAKMLLSGFMTKDFDINEWQKVSRYLAVGMTDVVIKETELINEYNILLKELETE